MYYQGGYGSPYGGYGAAPQLGALRKQQIDQLLAIYPATNRIQEGIYDLPIQLKATTNIYLRITLTPQFPTTAPRLEVFPKGLSHPLLDPNCLVIDPQLQSWGPHSSLSNIVRSIVDYFLSSPPTSRSSPAPPPRSAAYSGGRVPSPTYIPHAGSPAGGYRGASLPSQQRTPSPCNSGSLGGGPTSSSSNITVPPLDRYSVAELEELARDDARLEKMVNETPEVVAARKKQAELQAKIDQRRSEINAAAEEARAAEAQIAAKQKELDEIKKRNEELEAEKRGIEGKTLPPELAKELAKNAKSADAECDKIVSNFLAGEINAMQFANAYKEMRIVYYTRTKKLDHFRTFNSFK